MLIAFALIITGMFALGALVVDLRLVTSSQQVMQSAVDSAAIAATRFPAGSTEGRLAARLRLAQVFDDDLDATNGDELELSAGAVAGIEGGTGPADALGQIQARSGYEPRVELNLSNQDEGDLVWGIHDPAGDSIESSQYARDDFDPSPISAIENSTAFLVRLRRGVGITIDDQPGVSSIGPGVPLIFARGAPLAGESEIVRRGGFTVRATAIASSRAALAINGALLFARDGISLVDGGVAANQLDLATGVPVVGRLPRQFSGTVRVGSTLDLTTGTTAIAPTEIDVDLVVPVVSGTDSIVIGFVRLSNDSGAWRVVDRLPLRSVSGATALDPSAVRAWASAVAATPTLETEQATVAGRLIVAPTLVR